MTKYDFSRAVQILKSGGLIIYPTDTLYALGADIFNETAVKNVFDTKKRPCTVPLPVAVATVSAMETITDMNDAAYALCERFLPGSLTLILKKKPIVPQIVTSGRNTIAVRIPNNPVALQLLSKSGPLTATSANRHHEKTLGVISDIRMQLQTPHLFGLDNGRLSGSPSTMIDLSISPPQVVRKGTISETALFDVIAHG
jgi:L-threonylcarbamoyladenylate synthase